MIETEIERMLNDAYAAARNRGLSPEEAWDEREYLASLFSDGAKIFHAYPADHQTALDPPSSRRLKWLNIAQTN